MGITVKRARTTAQDWINAEASNIAGFCGAFLHGSTNWLDDEAVLPATSDVDVIVVVDNSQTPAKPGKFIYRGVLLDVGYVSSDRFQSPEQLLSNYQLAGNFRSPGILADPTGHLNGLAAFVAGNFAKRQWVYARCKDAWDKTRRDLEAPAAPFHDQVLAWLFGAGKATHILLVAGLKNPTVRQRYVAVHELLKDYGHVALHETLLDMLGCSSMTRNQASQHLAALTKVFDATCPIIKSPFSFTPDISPAARPVAVDGSRELIENGYHREAVFWIAVTYSRCQKALHTDAPPLYDRYGAGYRHLLGDLGIGATADLQRRLNQIKALLPQVWQAAEAIMAANPAIEDA